MDEAKTEVRRLLEAAIRRRLVSDVPLGAFLSGGIDSLCHRCAHGGCHGEAGKDITIGFDDRDGYDERPYARLWRNGLALSITRRWPIRSRRAR